MALSIYKTFTREKLVYQDLNALQQHCADYINDYCQLKADCVSTNTPLKAVKRDAAGNFAAGTITATSFVGALTGDVTGNVTGNLTGDVTGNVTGDLTGDVTGNANTATLAEAAKGDTRFQRSFEFIPGTVLGVLENVETIGFAINVPVGKALRLKGLQYKISDHPQVLIRVYTDIGYAFTTDVGNKNHITGLNVLLTSTSGLRDIAIFVRNDSGSQKETKNYDNIWLDLALE